MSLPDALPTLLDQTLEGLKAQESGEQKLLFALGETHTNPAHRAITAQLLTALKESNIHATLAVEIPADYMRQYLHEAGYPAADVKNISNRIEAADKNGHLRAHAIIADQMYDSHMGALLRTAMDHGQSIILVDKAVPPGASPTNVAMDDPRTRDTAERLGLAGQENLRALSADGVHLRNELMVDSCRDALDAKKEPHVVILLAGKNHVAGATKVDKAGTNYSFEQSLLALAENKGIAVRAALLGNSDNLPSAAPDLTRIEDKIDPEQTPGFKSHKTGMYEWSKESRILLEAAIENAGRGAQGKYDPNS